MLKEEVVAVEASLTLLVKTSAPHSFFQPTGMAEAQPPLPPLHMPFFPKHTYSEYVPGLGGLLLPSQLSSSLGSVSVSRS